MPAVPSRQDFIENGIKTNRLLDYFEILNVIVDQVEITTNELGDAVTNLAEIGFVAALMQEITSLRAQVTDQRQEITDLENAQYGY